MSLAQEIGLQPERREAHFSLSALIRTLGVAGSGAYTYASALTRFPRLVVWALAQEGYEPFLPALIPPYAEWMRNRLWDVRGTLEYVRSGPQAELNYQETATRWLVLDAITSVAEGLGTYRYSSDYHTRNAEVREQIAAMMPLICSLWPYTVAIHLAETDEVPYIDWKSVGSVVRFQGW